MPSLSHSRLVALLAACALPLAAQDRKPDRKPPTLPELEARAQRDSLDASGFYELSLGYYRAKRIDHLGLTQTQAAKTEEARANLQRFVSVAPSRYESLVTDAKQRLTGLGGQ